MGKDVSFGRGRPAQPRPRGLSAGPRAWPRATASRVMMPNVPQYPVAVAAILRAGLVVVNVNPLYTPRELEHQLKDSGSKAIVIMENFASTLQQCIAQHAGQARGARRDGRPARPAEGRAGQLRGAQREEDGAGLRACPGAVRFNDALAQGGAARFTQRRDRARRRRGAAVHRRHHRRVQGRRAAASQRDRQRAAVRGLEPAGDAARCRPASSPPASARCRCITSSPSR